MVTYKSLTNKLTGIVLEFLNVEPKCLILFSKLKNLFH